MVSRENWLLRWTRMNQQGPEQSLDERRMNARFSIQAPAVATFGNREIWAFTREISTRAIYFRTVGEDDRPPVGEVLEFVIKIPTSMSFSKPCFIRGRGRTVRIDDLGADESGVVVEILEYEIETESDHERMGARTSPGG